MTSSVLPSLESYPNYRKPTQRGEQGYLSSLQWRVYVSLLHSNRYNYCNYTVLRLNLGISQILSDVAYCILMRVQGEIRQNKSVGLYNPTWLCKNMRGRSETLSFVYLPHLREAVKWTGVRLMCGTMGL